MPARTGEPEPRPLPRPSPGRSRTGSGFRGGSATADGPEPWEGRVLMATGFSFACRLLAAGTVAAVTACGTETIAPPDAGDKWRKPMPGPLTRAPDPPRPQPGQVQPVDPHHGPAQTGPGDGGSPTPGKPGTPAEPGKEPPLSDRHLAAKARWTFDEMPLGPLATPERSDQAVGDTQTWRNLFDASWRGADGQDERPLWVVRGRWEIATADRPGMTGRVLRQTETRPEPVASFVQPSWPGGAGYPARYRVAVSVAADTAPRGQESPLLVWFQDVSRYAEIVAKPRSVEVWTADGAVPDRAEGWERSWYKALNTAPGEVRRLEAVMDVKAGRMTVSVDGERLGEASVPLVTRAASYSIALRATGGPIAYDDLEVEVLQ